jgi:membrane fusion protein, multidrug efflux system
MRSTIARVLVLGMTLGIMACGQGDAAPQAGTPQAGGGRPGGGGPGGGFGRGGGGPVAVETDTIIVGEIARQVSVSGTVSPIRTVGVNAQLAGALLAVLVQEGDTVAEGRVLARIDDRELQAQLRSAEAAFEVASSALERAEQLRERQVITQPEYERDRTAFEAARAQRDQLLTRVGFAEVRSPIRGVITEKVVEAGDVVGTNSRLFALADVSTMVVRVAVSELDVVEIAPGQEVDVRFDAYPGETVVGRVRRVFPSADPSTRLVPVEVALEGGEARRMARPGFLARVTFALDPHPGALLAPAMAVVSRTGGQGIFVVGSENTVAFRSVTTGASQDGRVELLTGVQVGDRVVVAGASDLRDGGQIRDLTPRGDRAAVAETIPPMEPAVPNEGGET